MVKVTVEPIDLKKLQLNETLVGVLVEVADNKTFTNPIKLGKVDEIKYDFEDNKRFAPKTIVYCRARYVLQPGGLQGWSDIIETVVDDKANVQINLQAPLVTEAPFIQPTLIRDTYPVKHLSFTITKPSFAHRVKEIQYVIEDNVKSVESGTTLDYNIHTHNELEPNTIYSLRAMYVFHDGHHSQLGGYVFQTGANKGALTGGGNGVYFPIGALKYNNDVLETVTVAVAGLTDSIELEIIKDGVVIYTTTSNVGETNVKGHVPSRPYTIAVTPTTNGIKGDTIYTYVNETTDSTVETLPQPLPYTGRKG